MSAVEKERMRIAQDMHDELGGKLSRISFLSDMARRGAPEESEATRPMDEVSEAVRDVIRTVDKMVWAVSPRNGSLESLSHYLCRHAEEFFESTAGIERGRMHLLNGTSARALLRRERE